MTDKAIFELRKITDNPLFEGLATRSDDASLLGRRNITSDFFPEDRNDWNWTLQPLASLWKPLETIGRVRAFNDCPFINLAVPAFSKRAVDGLRDMLEPNGEILPLLHPADTMIVG